MELTLAHYLVLGAILGSANAAAADHVIYGWVFFSLVMLLLVAGGMPFREDPSGPTPASPPSAAPTAASASSMRTRSADGRRRKPRR